MTRNASRPAIFETPQTLRPPRRAVLIFRNTTSITTAPRSKLSPTRNYCFRVEQENYDVLKSLWPNIPGNIKDKTLAKMHDITRGPATVTYPYTIVKGYLVAYLQAAEAARPAEQFRY